MAQISRPFQIALVAIVLLGGVWLFALKGGSSSTSTSGGSASSVPPAPASAPAARPSAPSSSAKGSLPQAPGVAGLTRAIEKAHGAVATSQQNARQLEQKSQDVSSSSAQTRRAGGTTAPGAAPSASAPATPAPSSSTSTRASKPAHGAPAQQRAVESELAAGDVVVLLFWNHKGSDDIAVHNVVTRLAGHGVAVHVSTAGQVADYGTVTRGVQVYSTPTTVVVGPSGRAKVITGLTDAYSLRQAISEALSGA